MPGETLNISLDSKSTICLDPFLIFREDNTSVGFISSLDLSDSEHPKALMRIVIKIKSWKLKIIILKTHQWG